MKLKSINVECEKYTPLMFFTMRNCSKVHDVKSEINIKNCKGRRVPTKSYEPLIENC